MPIPASHEVTQLLLAWSEGNQAALEQLMPLVYAELRRLAKRYMRNERPGHTLQTTALIHETYLRLIDARQVRWQNRAHFFAIAARLMRQILVDFARERGYQKRGGAARKVSLDEARVIGHEGDEALVAVDEALSALAGIDARKSQVEGETLRRRMESAPQEQMKLSEALDVAAQIAAALTAAHEAGIVHRDIKPENVMVRRDGYVKVLDFGLAKLTEPSAPVIESQASGGSESGVVMGTPRYMSPEQARGETVDARTDIFSLGSVLYEMLTGRILDHSNMEIQMRQTYANAQRILGRYGATLDEALSITVEFEGTKLKATGKDVFIDYWEKVP